MSHRLHAAVRFAPAALLAVLASCSSTSANKALVERNFGEVWSNGNFDAANEILSPSYVWRENSNEGSGLDNYKVLVQAYRSAFPDLVFDVQQTVAECDRVVTHWIARGTHEGDLMGAAPTGKRVAVKGITISRIEDGHVVEEWTTWDETGMLRQLGLAP